MRGRQVFVLLAAFFCLAANCAVAQDFIESEGYWDTEEELMDIIQPGPCTAGEEAEQELGILYYYEQLLSETPAAISNQCKPKGVTGATASCKRGEKTVDCKKRIAADFIKSSPCPATNGRCYGSQDIVIQKNGEAGEMTGVCRNDGHGDVRTTAELQNGKLTVTPDVTCFYECKDK